MKEYVFLDRGDWRPSDGQVFPHQDTETTVALENEHSGLFSQQFWPQENTALAGTAERGKQCSSDRGKSNEVKTNSRVAEGR